MLVLPRAMGEPVEVASVAPLDVFASPPVPLTPLSPSSFQGFPYPSWQTLLEPLEQRGGTEHVYQLIRKLSL